MKKKKKQIQKTKWTIEICIRCILWTDCKIEIRLNDEIWNMCKILREKKINHSKIRLSVCRILLILSVFEEFNTSENTYIYYLHFIPSPNQPTYDQKVYTLLSQHLRSWCCSSFSWILSFLTFSLTLFCSCSFYHFICLFLFRLFFKAHIYISMKY